ncbi:EscC/YscC/HrcC family type III secretion system outer membrane ring protein [Herbaspirillum sp. HC18]|nr:EscC/YscC/HrcC family type III secretion system outer membrane ring protein [Herbaspirillum sp. HC18]
MKLMDVRHWLIIALVALMLSWHWTARAATPASWKDTGFAINASGMTLREVLDEFGRVYSVRVAISTKADMYMKGRLKADSGSTFLDRLTQPYKFRWFVYNDTLYVVPRDENASMRLEVGEDAVQDAKAALVGMGLFDSRFGWGELADEGVVIVGGPRAYVKLVKDVLLPEEGKSPVKGKQIMVFRLKYASATDRVISSRGQTETIPGVKTVLMNLLFGQPTGEKLVDLGDRFDVGSGKRSRAGKAGKGTVRDIGQRTSSSNGRPQQEDDNADADRRDRYKTPAREDRPRIEADPTLNAIMIYDKPGKRETYRELIAQLDIEPQQVEIEALIVDIDRNKLSEIGVEWGVRKGNVVSWVNATGADSQGTELPIPGSTLLISNAARFYARLKALEGNGQARVLAKPTVLTLDNVAAVLDLSQTSYLPLVGERVVDLADVTAGTMLRVVPRIVRDGDNIRVRLEVDIEDGTLGDTSGQRTNVTRSTISTQAMIDLQQTLMIGGYHAESVSNNRQKIPVLGDVPLVGGLFRNETESNSTRERLFLITPRLAGATGAAAAAASRTTLSAHRAALDEAEAAEAMALGAESSETARAAKAAAAKARLGATPAPIPESGEFGWSQPKPAAKPKCARPKGAPLTTP